jgi:hypothetical protein
MYKNSKFKKKIQNLVNNEHICYKIAKEEFGKRKKWTTAIGDKKKGGSSYNTSFVVASTVVC